MKWTIGIIVLVAVAFGVYWFFIRRKPGYPVAQPTSGWAPQAPSITVSNPSPPSVMPSGATSGGGLTYKDGVTLAATAGCVAYTGGVGAPLCGIAAPLAVDYGIKAGTAVYSGVKSGVKSIGKAFGF